MSDLVPARQENLMPPSIERVPQVHASSFASWDDFGRWWWSLIEEELRPSPEIQAKVAQLTEGLQTPEEKLRAIYNFVVTDIRYNAWEFGVHGYEPYSAAVIFSRGFGDCKDKAILLKVMLGEAGITAWPVLIRMEDRRYEEDHSLALVEHFNHCIAYVPEQEGLSERFLDGTARFHSLNTLPQSDAGAKVLIVRNDGVENTRIRFPDAQENHIEQQIRVDLTQAGPAKVTVKRSVQGRYDVYDRNRFSGSNEQKMEQTERLLTGLFGALSGEPEAQWGDPENLNAPMESTFEVGVESVSRPTAKGVELPTTFEPMKLLSGLASETQRESDVLLDVPFSRETVIDYVLGEGNLPVHLPQPVEIETADARYTRTVQPIEGGVRVSEQFSLKSHRIPQDRYSAFRELSRAVDSAQADSIEVEVNQ
ncbi:MAG: transglutaminase domain-containing protein [Planctomycetota bacterium]